MDANGTRFHALIGDDWIARTERDGAAFDGRRHEITLAPLPFSFPAAPADRPATLEARRGAARDGYGNWYWIDETTTGLFVRSAGSGVTSVFWQSTGRTACASESPRRAGAFAPRTATAAPGPPLFLQGLAITADHHLVAGVLDPPGLLIFDLHAGGPPYQVCWPGGVAFEPFDMTPRSSGGVWVLDREHQRIWGFDRHFGVLRREPPPLPAMQPETFRGVDPIPVIGTPVACRADEIRAQDAWPAVPDAIAIEGYGKDGLLILDLPVSGADSRLHYAPEIGAPFAALAFPSSHMRGYDVAVARGRPRDPDDAATERVFVVPEAANQAVAFELGGTPGATTIAQIFEYYPVRLYGGKGLVSAAGDAYYDFTDAWIPLVEQMRPRYVSSGVVRIRTLDGKDPDCVWHRLILDGCIPPDTAIEVMSRAANEPSALPSVPWSVEPRPYLRHGGSELPFLGTTDGETRGSWELLVQRAKGRFLDIKIVLKGNGRSSPRVRALRAYYPRFSYLERYLPGVYRQEPEPASFLDRMLANMEGIFTTIEDRIAAAQVLMDVRTAPAESLDWMASWFEAALDPLWSDRKRRLFIAHAVELFERRGTKRGLQLALALTLFDCDTDALFDDRPGRSPAGRIRILEKFLTRQAPTGSWTLAEGRAPLSARYDALLAANGVTGGTGGHFPVVPPAPVEAAAVWRALAEDALGFVPAIATVAPDAWREFLARRYHSVAAFNEVYRLTGHPRIARFDELTPPRVMPPDGAPLLDWYEFETVVLAFHRTAHQFTVLLPVDRQTQADSARHGRLRDLAAQIVALEKPAHTVFDIRFYWSMFRVGEVRLGPDAVIGLGSRAPDVLLPMVLDRGHLAENYLAPSHPRSVTERRPVTGRDRPGCGC